MSDILIMIIQIAIFVGIAWLLFSIIGALMPVILTVVLIAVIYKLVKNLINKYKKNDFPEENAGNTSRDDGCDNEFTEGKTIIDVDYKEVSDKNEND